MFQKANMSYPLICTLTCAYQRVGNASFLENFAYILNEWSLTAATTRKIEAKKFLELKKQGNYNQE